MENARKLFIWDFHGTLEEGNDKGVKEITNIILSKFGHSRRMSMDEAEMLSGRRWFEYFSFLVPELTTDQCIEMQKECISLQQKQPELIASYIQPTKYAHEVLESIQRSGHTQIILSNTQQDSLDIFLKAIHVERFFDSNLRFGVDSHSQLKKSKRDYLMQFLKETPTFNSIITIGDSPGDVDLAECHPDGIGYLFTHPNRRHRQANCKYKIHDLRDILVELTN